MRSDLHSNSKARHACHSTRVWSAFCVNDYALVMTLAAEIANIAAQLKSGVAISECLLTATKP
jgi:hypothetical protein